MRINLKEADEAVEGYGAPGLGLSFVYLLFLQNHILLISQRITIDDVRERDLLPLLAVALEGYGGLASFVKHAKAYAGVPDHGDGFDRNVDQTYSQAA